MSHSLLIVDDDPSILESLAERFVARSFKVDLADNGREALEKARRSPDIILLDLQLPDLDGLQVLQALGREQDDCKVIVITAHGTIEKAVEAMQLGAYDFLQKPFEPALVESAIERALESTRLARENEVLKTQMSRSHRLVTVDPSMESVIGTLEKAAKSASTVVLLGESGTGKEVLARQIHQWSPRSSGPFVPINCVALPETLLETELFGHEKGAFTGAGEKRRGKIELADRGTLFLDEIGDISPAFQAKILRVIQERTFERVGGNTPIEVDVRLVAATHRDLKREVEEGRFREDLYYRLHVIAAKIPPLRERPADIRALVDHFTDDLCREMGKEPMRISDEVYRALQSHSWPGNARELRNALERAIVLSESDELVLEDLPPEIIEKNDGQLPTGFHARVEDARKQILEQALAAHDGNQTKTAASLGLQRTYLARLLKKYDLQAS